MSDRAEGQCPSQNSGAFYSEKFPRHVEQPREEMEEIPVPAAVGSGEFRDQRRDPSRLSHLGTAPQHSGSLPGSGGLWVTSDSFSCNRQRFSDAGTLSAHASFAFYLRRTSLSGTCEDTEAGTAGRASLFLLMILPCSRSQHRAEWKPFTWESFLPEITRHTYLYFHFSSEHKKSLTLNLMEMKSD